MNIHSDCYGCVFHVLRRCDGEPEPCDYRDTYDDDEYLEWCY